MKAQLYLVEKERRRDAQRRAVLAPATVRRKPGVPLDASIVNLSTSGVAIETDALLPLAEEIGIGIPGIGVVQAIVVRAFDSGYGCRFVEPVSEEQVDNAGIVKPLTRIGGDAPPAEERPHTPVVDKLSRPLSFVAITGAAALTWTLVVTLTMDAFR